MNLRSSFFDKGFVTPIDVLSKEEANSIFNDYNNFLNENDLKNSEIVEHKSKTHLFFPWANKLIFNKKILNCVREILGENFFCWNSLIFYKKPRSSSFVSMHQDQNYWGIQQDKALTVSLALNDSNEKNGCLKILPK